MDKDSGQRNGRKNRAAPGPAPGTKRGSPAAESRVADVQAQARPAFRISFGFVVAAAIAALAPGRSGTWLPLHLLFAGGLLSAISGATQLFAVTWASAPAPPSQVAMLQRWVLAAGAVLAAAGHEVGSLQALQYLGAALVGSALMILAVILVRTVRKGRLRRFDQALMFYLAAIAFGAAGVGIAPFIADSGASGPGRTIHALFNLLGLVGLTIAGTLPFFIATEARMKMSPKATAQRQTLLLALLSTSLAVAAGAIFAGMNRAAGAALAAYGMGLAGIAVILPTVGRKQLKWAGPRILQIGTGIVWWIGCVEVAAVAALAGGTPFARGSVAVIAVGAYLQILLGSLAYLGPVLRGGGHERLADGFRVTRSWESLIAANLAAAALAFASWETAPAAIAGLRPVGYKVAAVSVGVVFVSVVRRAAVLALRSRSEGV